MHNLSKPYVSFCIPTNGISEWVLPVLNSIYSQGVDENLFQVVVTDNGENNQFNIEMISFASHHKNLVYERNKSLGFLNQINALRLADGKLLKLINHRNIFVPGSIEYYIHFVNENMKEKPIVFFLNQNMSIGKTSSFTSFDSFLCALSIWSTWSGGLAIWKEDLEKICFDEGINEYFPHCKILFSITTDREFLIDNTYLSKEILTNQKKKGKYNLFYAFSVVYPSILLNLYNNDKIGFNTFISIKKNIGNLLSVFYLDYILRKKECSYDLSNYKEYLEVFYSYKLIKRQLPEALFIKIRNHDIKKKKEKMLMRRKSN